MMSAIVFKIRGEFRSFNVPMEDQSVIEHMQAEEAWVFGEIPHDLMEIVCIRTAILNGPVHRMP